MDGGVGWATVHGLQKVGHDRVTNQKKKKNKKKKMTKDVESSDRKMKYKASLKRLSNIFPKIMEK